VHNTAKNSFDIFPPNLQRIIIAKMLSIGQEGKQLIILFEEVLKSS